MTGQMKEEAKRPTTVYGDMVRSALTAYFRTLGLSGSEIQSLADELEVSRSTIESAVYKDIGGLDTYAAVFAKLHKVEKKNIHDTLLSFLEHLHLPTSRPTKSYLKWQSIAGKLTENKRLLWLSILDAAIDAERKFKAK